MPTRIIMAGGPPYCPLCDKRMRETHFVDPRTKRVSTFYICTRADCMVSINKKDPSIKKWRTIDAPECQFCHNPMRMFFRQDKFIKLQCWDKSHRPYQIMRGNAEAMPPIKT